MRKCESIPFSMLEQLPPAREAEADALLQPLLDRQHRKIVVLDDDPTGVQTVHDISVYTDWKPETLLEGFREENRLFFVLTNSRAFTREQTIAAHREMAQAIAAAARETGQDFLVISRSDSTLRGHYPTETETLRQQLEELTGQTFDGEVIFPYFREGGRYTLGDVHYVKEGEWLVPAGQTEFARDKTFGYRASDLKEWCEEKTGGAYPARQVVSITLDELRALDVAGITSKLMVVRDFGKVVVNAAHPADVKVFAAACLRALEQGKRFLYRSAAALPKVLGGVTDRPLLTHEELVEEGNPHGGIVLIGSHVQKTTRQMEQLRHCRKPLEFLEFNQHLVLQPGGLAGEVDRVVALAQRSIQQGQSVVVYTRRERFDIPGGDAEAQLRASVAISDAVTSIIARLEVKPSFIVAKGGITSSDVGVKALRVRRATVMGQIRPGIPVWRTGAESKFPYMPYVIFPGNVGEDVTLKEAVDCLMGI
ncbi:MAG: four-carbon acid sugar kinase family protein [Eubacteriales bacterium]|jgi:uncharacterized protein YgbK (DUF1537 family)